MGTWVQWFGYGVRTAHGYTWQNGDTHFIEDETVALDLLTQPGERFEVQQGSEDAGEQGSMGREVGETFTPAPPHPRIPAPLLTDVEGIGPKRAAELAGAGIGSVAALAGLLADYVALRATLAQLTGVSEATLLNWSRAAGELLGQTEE